MRRYFTRGDIILIGTLTLFSLASLGGIRRTGFSGNHVVVTVDGHLKLELPLDRDTTASVHGPLGDTQIVVENGTVHVGHSPCPDGLCMHMGRIRHTGETLICVPNRVFVTVRGDGGEELKFDGVAE